MASTVSSIKEALQVLDARAKEPEQDGLQKLLVGLAQKLETPGVCDLEITLIGGKVQRMRVLVTDTFEEVYFPA